MIKTLTTAELMKAASANMAAHVSWIQSQTAGMQVEQSGDLVASHCGMPCDTFNVVCHARLTAETAPARIRSVIEHYAGSAFCWWLNPGDQPGNLDELLREAGLQADGSEVAMAMDLDKLPTEAAPLPPNYRVERVRTEQGLRDFARIMAANWTPPDVMVERFYEQAAPVALRADSPLWYYVGYVGDEAVAASQLTLGGGVAGLYNVCTLASHRRKGYGTALTRQPLIDARSQGQHSAILQAAPDGVGIYTRQGFEPFGPVTEYKLPQ